MEAQGPIASIDTATSTFVVLGQTVHVTGNTIFDNSIPGQSLSGLQSGDSIDVSGQFMADGSISATRIEMDTPGQYEVTGKVSNVDTANSTFDINQLVVDYSQATAIQGFGTGAPANGDLVNVEGTTINSNGALVASTLVNETNSLDQNVQENDDVSVQGPITNFVSVTEFEVAGQAVTTNSSTTYENGTSADLANNVQVQVEGNIGTNGVLVAKDIEFQSPPKVEVEGQVSAIDTTNNTVVVMGLTFQLTSSTRISDDSNADLQNFTLSDLQVGDYVDISASQASTRELTALKLERINSSTTNQIDAVVSSVADPNFTMLGITVTTSSSTRFVGTTATNFFAAATGKKVDVTGVWTGTELAADTVEFDN